MARFYRFWLITLFIKCFLAVWLPLSADEAYYWVWGGHPQLSYYDHPPMVGWLFWLGRWLDFGGQASRLPAVLLGHATLLVWNQILKPYLDERSRRFWLLFVLLSPFLGIGSLIVTPDLPLVFFWSLALLAFRHLFTTRTALAYALFGAVLGLGFCAKYHMVLFVPIALVWIAVSGRWREVRYPLIPLTIVMGLVFCFPVWYWNMTHDWVSFRFQLEHGLKGGPWKPTWPLAYIAGQIALIFPPILILALRRREPKEARWLHAFAWLPLLFFLYTSFKARVEANWPVIAHPAVLALAFLNNPASRWIRATMVIWGFALLVVISQVAFPWIPVATQKLKTSEFTKFDPLLPEADRLSPFYASSYQMASALSYKRKAMIYKLNGMNRRDFYDFHPMSVPQSEVFYLAAEPEQVPPAWLEEKGYKAKLLKDVTPELKIFEVRRAQDSGH